MRGWCIQTAKCSLPRPKPPPPASLAGYSLTPKMRRMTNSLAYAARWEQRDHPLPILGNSIRCVRGIHSYRHKAGQKSSEEMGRFRARSRSALVKAHSFGRPVIGRRPGASRSLRRLFASIGHFECYGDLSPTVVIVSMADQPLRTLGLSSTFADSPLLDSRSSCPLAGVLEYAGSPTGESPRLESRHGPLSSFARPHESP